MNVFPHGSIKQLVDCKPGELIIPKGYGDDRIAVVAYAEDNEDYRFLIFLNGIQEILTPCYLHITRPPAFVFSYGMDYEILYDFTTLDFDEGKHWQASGCLQCVGKDWLMIVRPAEKTRHANMCYNVITGRIVETPNSNVSAFVSKWKINLLENIQRRSELSSIVKFEQTT